MNWIHNEFFVQYTECGMTKSNIVSILGENEFEIRFLYPGILQFVQKDKWKHLVGMVVGEKSGNNAKIIFLFRDKI